MTPVRLTLISKPGCHLCEEAAEAVERVRGRVAVDTEVEELDILEDAELARLHSEYIPVLLVNGRRLAVWRVDEEKLAAAIEKAAPKRRLFRSRRSG